MFCGYDFQFYFKLHTAKRLIHIHHPTKRNGENSMTKPIILLVEDLDDNATLVRKVLTARGYEVLWANTGQRGLDMASEHPPGLILLDLGLPDIDGQTLVRYFRNMPELDDVPIIVVTAWPEATAKKMVTAYGCNGYIGKPVDIHLLSDTVNDYFKTA
jgi:two-component system cell cycle response regulator DivK